MKSLLTIMVICLTVGSLYGEEVERFQGRRSTFLESIVIPVVILEDATIREALDFAWARTVELDTVHTVPSQKGVSILLRYPSGEMYPRRSVADLDPPKNPKKLKITFRARNISLSALLEEIARQAGYDLYTTSVGVVFCPPGTSPFPNAHSSKGDIWEALAKTPRQQQEHKPGEQVGAPNP